MVTVVVEKQLKAKLKEYADNIMSAGSLRA